MSAMRHTHWLFKNGRSLSGWRTAEKPERKTGKINTRYHPKSTKIGPIAACNYRIMAYGRSVRVGIRDSIRDGNLYVGSTDYHDMCSHKKYKLSPIALDTFPAPDSS